MELQTATALVTGATGNLGPHVMDELVSQGATVIGTYVSDTDRTNVDDRTDQSDAISYYQVDLTNQRAVEAFELTGGQPEVEA